MYSFPTATICPSQWVGDASNETTVPIVYCKRTDHTTASFDRKIKRTTKTINKHKNENNMKNKEKKKKDEEEGELKHPFRDY